MPANDTFPARRAGLARRLAAMSYDALLLLSVLFFATLMVLPLTGGDAITSGNPVYMFYLLAISYLYFVWHWTRGGQTLGMRAWQLRLFENRTQSVGWPRASLRFLAAILSWLLCGGGFVYCIFDRQNRTLHDRLSGTDLFRINQA